MTAIIAFISRYWLHIAVVAAVLVGLNYVYSKGYDKADSEWQSKWDAEQLRIVELNAEHERKLREQEQQWQIEFNRISKDAQIQQNQIASNLAAANRERDSLQQQYKKALQSRQCGNTTATSGSQSAGAAEDMPSYVFDRTDETAGTIAEYADRLKVALSACNSAYARIYPK